MRLKQHFKNKLLCKWGLIQLAIQLIPSPVTEHGVAVYGIKATMLIVHLTISILIFINSENDLISLLKNMTLTKLKLLKEIKYLKMLLKIV